MLLVSSNWHLRPGDRLPRFALKFLEIGSKEQAKMVLNGDIFDFLPYGEKAWRKENGVKTIGEFNNCISGLDVELVAGSHINGYG